MATDKLKRIAAFCRASVTVQINDHRDMYESIEDRYGKNGENGHLDDHLTPEIFEEMKKRDYAVEVRAYPRTPISFYLVIHYDLDAALDKMLTLLEDDAKEPRHGD